MKTKKNTDWTPAPGMACNYLWTCKENGKVYIGWTGDTSLSHMRGYHSTNKYLIGRALRKHGIDGFCREILFTGPRQECIDREQGYIIQYNARGTKGYNIGEGGEGRTSREQKALWNRPGFGVKFLSRLRELTSDVDHQRKASRAAWVGSNHRRKMKKVLNRINSDPKIRRARRERMKAFRKDPEFNRRLAEAKRLGSHAKRIIVLMQDGEEWTINKLAKDLSLTVAQIRQGIGGVRRREYTVTCVGLSSYIMSGGPK